MQKFVKNIEPFSRQIPKTVYKKLRIVQEGETSPYNFLV